jgi:hypothetical protein
VVIRQGNGFIAIAATCPVLRCLEEGRFRRFDTWRVAMAGLDPASHRLRWTRIAK